MTTQQDCSLGFASETTYGVGVTPTKFPEFTDEDFAWNPTFIQGQGMRVGTRIPRLGRRALGKQIVGGGVTVEAASKGLGALLEAALGAVTTTQRATTGVYQQVHTPSSSGVLKSYTWQKGIPLLGGGAVQAHTFRGMVCDSLELNLSNANFLTAKTSWTGKEVDTVTSYAAPSYPAAMELFTFAGAAITIGGTVVEATTTAAASGGTAVADVVDFNLTYNNNLDDGGIVLGSGGKRGRRPELGMGAIAGKLTAEFDTVALRDAYLNQSDLGLLLTFVGGTTIGTGTDKPTLQIRVPAIRLEGQLPNANGGDVVTQDVGFTGLDNSTLPPISIIYASTDTAP